MKQFKRSVVCPVCGKVYTTTKAATCGRPKCNETMKEWNKAAPGPKTASAVQLQLF